MLSLASYPPNQQEIEQWFADHQRQWEVGEAYRFAVVLEGKMVGVDIDGITDREGTLRYWLVRALWGHGYAFEAAQRDLLSKTLFLLKLKAGHAHDNPKFLPSLGSIASTLLSTFHGHETRKFPNAAT